MRPRLAYAAAVAGLGMAGALALALAPSVGADTAGSNGSFVAAAQAPVFQVTEDEPSATFHPEGEANFTYTLATLDQSHGYALSSYYWPGGAGGNAGSLAIVLGAPSQASAANDPVRAEAITGTPPDTKSTTTPTGATMSASVKPSSAGPQATARASTSDSGTSLGAVGSVGSTVSESTSSEDATSGLVTAKARSTATGVDLGGVFHVGSVTSTASVTSDGTPPSGSTVFSDMTIGGQQAYVDGNGVHMGTPGKPPSAETLGFTNTALAAAGMSIYFTKPATIPVGGVKYYYAASVLVFWAPPGSKNSFTVSLGGAAASLAGSGSPASTVTPPETGAPAPIPPNPTPTTLSLPANGPTTVALGPALPAGGPSAVAQPAQPVALAVATPHGIGKWVVAVVGGLLAGGLTLPHVPGLFSASAQVGCERERRLRTLFRRW